jgi:hypothetical protein
LIVTTPISSVSRPSFPVTRAVNARHPPEAAKLLYVGRRLDEAHGKPMLRGELFRAGLQGVEHQLVVELDELERLRPVIEPRRITASAVVGELLRLSELAAIAFRDQRQQCPVIDRQRPVSVRYKCGRHGQ